MQGTPHRGNAPATRSQTVDLTRRFGVCAGAEVSELGMTYADRKEGIPTLAVFRASDEVLLTMNGVDNVMAAGAGAVDRWEAAASAAAAKT